MAKTTGTGKRVKPGFPVHKHVFHNIQKIANQKYQKPPIDMLYY